MLIMTLAESDGHSSRLLSSEGADGASLLLLASYCHNVGVAGKVGGGDGWKERGERNFLGLTSTKLLMEGTLVDDQISILCLRSGPRTMAPKLVGQRAGHGGTIESDVVRITL